MTFYSFGSFSPINCPNSPINKWPVPCFPMRVLASTYSKICSLFLPHLPCNLKLNLSYPFLMNNPCCSFHRFVSPAKYSSTFYFFVISDFQHLRGFFLNFQQNTCFSWKLTYDNGIKYASLISMLRTSNSNLKVSIRPVKVTICTAVQSTTSYSPTV